MNKSDDKEKSSTEDKEEASNPLDVSISTVVHDILAELNKDASAGVAEILERNWIATLAHWDQVKESDVAVPGLPALFVVRLNERVKRLKEGEPQLGPTEEEIRISPEYNADEEDKEQNRIVLELAEAFAKGEKHKVLCKVFVNKLENLSTADWSVSFDIGVQCWFLSDEHVGWHSDIPNMETVFKPDFEFMNATQVECVVLPEEGGSFYIRDRYKRFGIVNWYQRYRGTVKQDLTLQKFPFDSQKIAIRFGMTLYGAEDVLLLNRTDPSVVASFDEHVKQLHEWGMEGSSKLEELVVFNEEDKRDISYLEYSFTVYRLGSYYMINVILVVYFLNVLTWWLFLIDPNTLNDRLQICITAFLALVAFNFVIAETLPKINHSTYLTHFFGVNYGAISLAALESGISFLIDKYLPENGFNTAKILDWSTMGFIALVQTVLIVIFAVLAKKHSLRPK